MCTGVMEMFVCYIAKRLSLVIMMETSDARI